VAFNSFEFLFFLAITYLLYCISNLRGQNIILLVASYVFYASWDIRLLFLIVLSTAIDFCCGVMIESGHLTRFHRYLASSSVILASFAFNTLQWDAVEINVFPLGILVQWSKLLPTTVTGWSFLLTSLLFVIIANVIYPRCISLKKTRKRQIFLWIGIITHLLILGFFKYCNFFIDSAINVVRVVGIPIESIQLTLIASIGISFYTFKAISYVVDVYKGKIEACYSFLNFALFLSFFPPLLAGPIDRAGKLLPQLSNPRYLRFQTTSAGIFLILFGLFKKLAIADGIASSVNAIYQSTGKVSWLDVVLATLLFTIQIYCDFSGYSDTARGISKLFGIDLTDNFNLPYFSKTPSEFWQRWHISLSTWLRDYLYIPLGGNRQGERRTYQNLMGTMVLGGLWHGAALNFILWGFYQGGILCIYRFFYSKDTKAPAFRNKNLEFLWRIGATLLFFVVTCYGWLLFRATSLTQVITFTKILITDFGNLSLSMPEPPLAAILGIPLLISYEFFEYLAGKTDFRYHFPPPVRAALYAVIIFILLMGTSNAPAQFIYATF
jgi:alginate O-acetyltransferase complex protein AlgI